jgi:hypothetical protein
MLYCELTNLLVTEYSMSSVLQTSHRPTLDVVTEWGEGVSKDVSLHEK